jgi:hypothetical protein
LAGFKFTLSTVRGCNCELGWAGPPEEGLELPVEVSGRFPQPAHNMSAIQMTERSLNIQIFPERVCLLQGPNNYRFWSVNWNGASSIVPAA